MYSSNDTIILNLTENQKTELKIRFILQEYSLNTTLENSLIKFECCRNHDFFGPIVVPKILTESDSVIVLHKGAWSNSFHTEPVYFVIGDNVQETLDSRYFGFVPFSYIIGKLPSRPSE